MSSDSIVTTETLRRLHCIHEQLRDLRERSGRGPRIAKAHEVNLARLESQLAELQGKAKELRVKTDEKQLNLKSGEANVERRRQQLREAKDNRGYQALVEQIKADEMANSVREDEILECMEKLDQLVARVQQAEQDVTKARHDATAGNRQWQEEAPLIQGDIQRLEAELRQVEENLNADFRELYRRLVRAKGEDALAPIHGEFCGGCHQHVPLNMVNAVMLGKPVCCKSCGRLLYIEEDQLPAKPAEDRE
jgi:predicted  nucleic acid-binding Zn-ribbon protein